MGKGKIMKLKRRKRQKKRKRETNLRLTITKTPLLPNKPREKQKRRKRKTLNQRKNPKSSLNLVKELFFDKTYYILHKVPLMYLVRLLLQALKINLKKLIFKK